MQRVSPLVAIGAKGHSEKRGTASLHDSLHRGLEVAQKTPSRRARRRSHRVCAGSGEAVQVSTGTSHTPVIGARGAIRHTGEGQRRGKTEPGGCADIGGEPSWRDDEHRYEPADHRTPD